MPKTIAIVPMRHFSQRVPGKNYRPLGNQPLYFYIIKTLIDSRVDRIIIDTDSEIIKKGIKDSWGNNPKIDVLTRPQELCLPEISMNKIILSILSRIWDEIDDDTIILQTHATNPFVRVESINRALVEFNESDSDTLVSVNVFQSRLWNQNGLPVNHDPNNLIQTQDLKQLYEENSCLYIFKVTTIKTYGNRIGPKKYFFPMNQLESWDIDTEDDFNLAQAILKQSQASNLSLDNSNLGNPVVKINQNLFDLLNQELKSEIDQFLLSKNDKYRVMISAPYMMKDIETFKQFYQSLGLDVIVADVKERLSEVDLMKYNGKYDIVLAGDDSFTKRILTESGVRAICKWGTGIDSFDQMSAKNLGIPIYNTENAFTVPVAQSIVGAILNHIRNLHSSTILMRNSDQWVKIPGKTLEECTVGIIGFGNIGSQVAKYLTPFEPKILAYDISSETTVDQYDNVKSVNLDTLLANSDIICTCCTLGPSSYHILDQDAFKKMKRGVYIVNMARGKLIHQDSLIKSLQNGLVSGAALDVFEDEPLPKESLLRKMDNVMLAAHNSNSSQKYWNLVHLNTIRNSLKAMNTYTF